jgi:hypothetical protein
VIQWTDFGSKQVMLAVLNDPSDPTMIYLVFANSTLDDAQ